MLLRTVTLASLLLACCLSSPAQNVTPTDTKPQPLKKTSPSTQARGIIRWHGAVGTRPDDDIGRSEWTADGSRLLTSRKNGTAVSVEIWKASEDRKSVSFDGSLNIGETWALSPDGKRIVGLRFDDVPPYTFFEMHDLDTLEGIWSVRVSAMSGSGMMGAAFSKDGKWLAILLLQQRELSDKRDYAVTILEAETGKHIQTILLKPDDGHPSNWQFHKMAFTKDALWIAPRYNEGGQAARISIGDWKKTFVSDPISEDEDAAGNLTASSDGNWIVLWGGARYRAMQMSGDKLALRFEGEAEYSKYGGACGFNSANISPDNRLLTISGNGRHKVIDLEGRKVVHEDTKKCLCGLFAPDGKTFWGTCTPFQSIDVKSWEPSSAETTPGHRTNVQTVAFSPDGKLLASQDSECIYLWSVDGSAPPRKLVSSPGGGSLLTLEWKPDGTEVWSGDGVNFIRWRLSENTPPGTPQYSEKLFPGTKSQENDSPWLQRIRPIPGTDLAYLYTAYRTPDFSYRLYEEVRSPSKPAVVIPVRGDHRLKGEVQFSASGEEIFDIEYGSLIAFKWSDGTVRKGMSADNTLLGGGGANGPLVLFIGSQLVLADPVTLQQTRALLPPKDAYYSGTRTFVSPDGQWLVCSSSHRYATPGRSPDFLVNIKGDGEAYRLPLTDNVRTCGAFSRDGRLLALGHTGGLVSFWDTEKIKSESGPVPLEAPNKYSSSFRVLPRRFDWPGPGLPLTKGDSWSFTDDGGIQCPEANTLAGQLQINGKAPKALTKSINSLVAQGKALTYLSAELELRSDDAKIRVARNVDCRVNGISQWLDTVENLSAEPLTVVLTYSTKLGSSLEGLRDRNADVPTALPDGTLQSKIPITELSARSEKDGVSRYTSMAFSTPSSPVQPLVKWDRDGNRIVKEWTLKLQPFEKRMLIQEFSQNRVSSSETPTVHKLALFNRSLLPRLPSLVNFVPDEEERRFLELDYPRFGLDTDGTKKDDLGFKWRPEISAGFGMAAELGADRFYDVWLNGAPGMGSAPGMMMPRPSSVQAGPRLGKSTDGKIQTKRRHHLVPEIGMLMMHDEITNTGTEASTVQVLFNTVALNRFVQVVDAKGKLLNCNAPLKFKDNGGQVALISEGPTKPSVLLAFGGPKGVVQPSVKLVAGRGFFVGYSLQMKTGETISLLHLAIQRPFSAYDSAAKAFVDLDASYALDIARTHKWPVPANW